MRRKSLTFAAAAVVAVASLMVVPAAAAEQQAGGPPDAARTSCAEPDRSPPAPAGAAQQQGVCFTTKAPPGVTATKVAKVAAPSGVGTSNVPCYEEVWTSDRKEACSWIRGWLEVYVRICTPRCSTKTIGYIEVIVRYWSFAYPTDGHWLMRAEVEALQGIEAGAQGAEVTGTFYCEGACSATTQAFYKQRLRIGGKVAGDGWFATSLENRGDVRHGNGGVTLNFEPVGGGFVGSHSETVRRETRCDWTFSRQGCVFHEVAAVFDVPTWLHPGAASHIKRAQASGLPGHDVPLTRTADPEKRKKNRDVACPDYIPRPPGKSCDEYPFASTNQGAAATGDVAYDVGRTFTGCEMTDLPQGKEPPLPGIDDPIGWSACFIDEDDNWDSGGELGNFYPDNRVLDNEQFYVEVIS